MVNVFLYYQLQQIISISINDFAAAFSRQADNIREFEDARLSTNRFKQRNSSLLDENMELYSQIDSLTKENMKLYKRINYLENTADERQATRGSKDELMMEMESVCKENKQLLREAKDAKSSLETIEREKTRLERRIKRMSQESNQGSKVALAKGSLSAKSVEKVIEENERLAIENSFLQAQCNEMAKKESKIQKPSSTKPTGTKISDSRPSNSSLDRGSSDSSMSSSQSGEEMIDSSSMKYIRQSTSGSRTASKDREECELYDLDTKDHKQSKLSTRKRGSAGSNASMKSKKSEDQTMLMLAENQSLKSKLTFLEKTNDDLITQICYLQDLIGEKPQRSESTNHKPQWAEAGTYSAKLKVGLGDGNQKPASQGTGKTDREMKTDSRIQGASLNYGGDDQLEGIISLIEKNKSLENENIQIKRKSDTMLGKIRENGGLRENLKEAEENCKRMQERVVELERVNEESVKQLKAVSKESDDMKQRYVDARKNYDALCVKIQSLTETIVDSRVKVFNLPSALETIKKSYIERQSQISNLQKQLKELETMKALVVKEKETVTKEVHSLKEHSKVLRKQIEEFQIMEKNFQNLKAKFKKQQECMEQERSEKDSLVSSNKNLVEDNKCLRKKLDHVTEANKNQSESKARIEKECHGLKREIERISLEKKSQDDAVIEKQLLKEKLMKVEDDNKGLKIDLERTNKRSNEFTEIWEWVRMKLIENDCFDESPQSDCILNGDETSEMNITGEEIRNKIFSLIEANKAFREEIENHKTENQYLGEKLKAMAKDLEDMVTRNTEAKHYRKDLFDNIVSIGEGVTGQSLGECNEEWILEAIKKTYQDKLSDIVKLKLSIEAFEKNKESMTINAKSQTEEISDLEFRCNELQCKIEEYEVQQREYEDLRRNLRQLEKRYEDLLQQARENEAHQGENKDLNRINEDLLKENNDLQQQSYDAGIKMKAKDDYISSLEKEVEKLMEEVKEMSLTDSIANSRVQHDLSEKVVTLEVECKRLKKEMETKEKEDKEWVEIGNFVDKRLAESCVLNKTTEISGNEKQKETKSATIMEEIQQKIIALFDENDGILAVIADKKKEMESLQDRFDLIAIQNKEYSHHISRLILTERENSALRTRLQKLSSECFSMRKDFDYLLEKENAFSELAKVHDSLLDEYETLRKDNNKLASQFKENEQMLELLQQENDMLHKKCQKFDYQSQNDIQGFQNELQDVEIILKQNIEEKQKLQENIAELNEQLEIKDFEILEAQEKVEEISRKLVKQELQIQDMTELKKENEKIQELVLEQQNTISVIKVHKAEMATEIENLKTLNARFEDIKEQNVELNSILTETKEKVSDLERENRTTKEEASNFIQMYEESLSELEQCRNNLEILQNENENLNDTCKRIDCQIQANLENKAENDNEIRLSEKKIEVHGDRLLNTNDVDQEDIAGSTTKSKEISHEEFVDIFLTPTRIETRYTDCEEDVSAIDNFLLNDDKFEEQPLPNIDIKEQSILDIVSNNEMKDLCHQKSKKSVHAIQGAREEKRRNSAENAFQERLENVLKANVVLAEEKFEIEAKLQESLKENEAMTFQIIMVSLNMFKRSKALVPLYSFV